MIESLLVAYGTRLPYHPGKWRLIETMVRRAGILRGDDHRLAERAGIRWDLHIRDIVQRSVYFLGVYEIHETRWLLAQIRPGWVACDIGSNFGYYSHLIAGNAGPDAVIHAFEPNPGSFATLCRIRDLNGFTTIRPHAVAVAAARGTLDLEIPPDGNEGIGRLLPPGAAAAPRRRTTRVEALPLDEIAERENLRRLDFVKIDVEGAEPGVFDGGETLRRLRPRILVEINPEASGHGVLPPATCWRASAIWGTPPTASRDGTWSRSASPAFPDYINAICLPLLSRPPERIRRSRSPCARAPTGWSCTAGRAAKRSCSTPAGSTTCRPTCPSSSAAMSTGGACAIIPFPLPGIPVLRRRQGSATLPVANDQVANVLVDARPEILRGQILQLHAALNVGAAVEVLPYIVQGKTVRILGGMLKGTEGVVQHIKGRDRVVLNIELIGQSVAVEIDGALLAPVN
ncbi:MAG: FkbM family methyltransferase [Kiritimatiellia bacterium]